EIDPDMPAVQLVGRLTGLAIAGEKRGKRLVGRFSDDTGSIELVWFQSIRWLSKNLKEGGVYLLYGKPSSFNNSISVTHPELELYDTAAKISGSKSLQPVYHSSEKLKQVSLDTKGILKLQAAALEIMAPSFTDVLPDYMLEKYRLIPLARAMTHIHFPPDNSALADARLRLKFDELFLIQLRLLRNKLVHAHRFMGYRFEKVGDKFNS